MIDRSTSIRRALRQRQRGFIINPFRFGGGSPPSPYVIDLQFPGADGSTTFTDNVSGRVWTTFGNAQVDTSLGDQRGLFDGNGDYATTPDAADLNFGTGDFKISFIQRYSSKSGFQTIAAKGYSSASSGGWLIQTGNGDGCINLYSLSPAAALICGESSGTINTGQDYLIEIERVGTSVTIKRDGVTVASGTSSFNFSNTAVVAIGGGSNLGFDNFWFNGWLKSLQVTNG